MKRAFLSKKMLKNMLVFAVAFVIGYAVWQAVEGFQAAEEVTLFTGKISDVSTAGGVINIPASVIPSGKKLTDVKFHIWGACRGSGATVGPASWQLLNSEPAFMNKRDIQGGVSITNTGNTVNFRKQGARAGLAKDKILGGATITAADSASGLRISGFQGTGNTAQMSQTCAQGEAPGNNNIKITGMFV
jgi:hypothetical protein